ncbi:MAG TPA: FAD-binding oxidoreductase [Terriglobia bacterium]|nr:FAD-binding oxidoreductase [Terriglobia bacterium]
MTIDGVSPSRVVTPESVEELAKLISNEKGAVVPVGSGTQLEFGNPLWRADCAFDLKALSRITEYTPADLTIHVEAGVTLDHLQRTLLENKQFLPLDPWNGPSATIGGIAATNAQGPLRASGTIRDWIIGMRVVEVDGRVSKAGGRVVKNVTGYDLHKLYTGSLGTLAIIAEISLKLRANFERTATAIARFADSAAAAACLASIRKSSLQPIACEWVGPENTVGLRFGDNAKAVDWQLKNLPPEAEWNIKEGPDEIAAFDDLRARYTAFEPIVVRAIGLPAQVHEIIKEYQPAEWIAHALNGIVLMRFNSPADIIRVRQRYRAIIEKAPVEVRREVATFGLTPAEKELMTKMKAAFDPDGRLNPGRHVDGE